MECNNECQYCGVLCEDRAAVQTDLRLVMGYAVGKHVYIIKCLASNWLCVIDYIATLPLQFHYRVAMAQAFGSSLRKMVRDGLVPAGLVLPDNIK